ncbi:SAM-dependent methyltransferase, partial [Mycobacterium sp. ITM-2017-0098]
MSDRVDNPFFARLWTAMSSREPESLRRLRKENLAGLTGRVLEVGAGTGTNFEFYPATVTEVVAVEPERRLAAVAQRAAAGAGVPVTVSTDTVEQFADAEPFDAVVCSLVLCSVDDPAAVVGQLFSLLKPGGELRYLEHVAGYGARARLQKFADATVWPRLLGNCHTHRHTEDTIVGAGFRVTHSR